VEIIRLSKFYGGNFHPSVPGIMKLIDVNMHTVQPHSFDFIHIFHDSYVLVEHLSGGHFYISIHQGNEWWSL
jgi:hypothetical protein